MTSFADLGIVAVPVITVIAFLVAEAVKLAGLDSKWCPVICGVVGGALGAAAMSIMPEYPASDILTAIAVGIVSGLAATGVHQLYVQLVRKGESGQHLEGKTPAAPDPEKGEPTEVPTYEEIRDEFK